MNVIKGHLRDGLYNISYPQQLTEIETAASTLAMPSTVGFMPMEVRTYTPKS